MSKNTKNNKVQTKAEETNRKEAQRQAKEKADQEAKAAAEKAKADAETARKAKETEETNRKEAERQAKEKAKQEAAGQKKKEAAVSDEITSGIYQGTVQLLVIPPSTPGQVKKLQEFLAKVQGLHIILIGGSTVSGTELVVTAEQPLNLAGLLNEIPVVAQVVKRGPKIGIILKPE